jgi:hypothetical protein
MTRKRAALIGAVCALAGSATTAAAQTNHVFGNGGDAVQFDAACHRPSWAKPENLNNREGDNVTAQQARCLVRRPTFAACVRHWAQTPFITEKADHGPGKPGDESGAAAFEKAVRACAVGTF